MVGVGSKPQVLRTTVKQTTKLRFECFVHVGFVHRGNILTVQLGTRNLGILLRKWTLKH